MSDHQPLWSAAAPLLGPEDAPVPGQLNEFAMDMPLDVVIRVDHEGLLRYVVKDPDGNPIAVSRGHVSKERLLGALDENFPDVEITDQARQALNAAEVPDTSATEAFERAANKQAAPN